MTFPSLREGMGGSVGLVENRLQLTLPAYTIICTAIIKEHFALYENTLRAIKEIAPAG